MPLSNNASLIKSSLIKDAQTLLHSALAAKNDSTNIDKLKAFVSNVETFIKSYHDPNYFVLINNDFFKKCNCTFSGLLAQYIIICEPREGIIPRMHVRFLPSFLIKAVDKELLKLNRGDLQVNTDSEIARYNEEELEKKRNDLKFFKEAAEVSTELPLTVLSPVNP